MHNPKWVVFFHLLDLDWSNALDNRTWHKWYALLPHQAPSAPWKVPLFLLKFGGLPSTWVCHQNIPVPSTPQQPCELAWVSWWIMRFPWLSLPIPQSIWSQTPEKQLRLPRWQTLPNLPADHMNQPNYHQLNWLWEAELPDWPVHLWAIINSCLSHQVMGSFFPG